MWTRREALTRLLGAAAVGSLSGAATSIGQGPQVGEPPLAVLDRVNLHLARTFPPFVLGPYRCHFTGLKGSRQDSSLAGQWLGWPIRPLDMPERWQPPLPYYMASVPGDAAGTYQKGEVFQIVPGLSLEDLDGGDVPARVLDAVAKGRARLIRVITEAHG